MTALAEGRRKRPALPLCRPWNVHRARTQRSHRDPVRPRRLGGWLVIPDGAFDRLAPKWELLLLRLGHAHKPLRLTGRDRGTTTRRFRLASGGRMPRIAVGAKLAAVAETCGAPWTGLIRCGSTWRTRGRGRTVAEARPVDGHDCMRHAHVPVDADVVHAHDRLAVDHHVVHDARAIPAPPGRLAGRAPTPPPRHDRLAPAERNPAHCRPSRAADCASARLVEESHQGRRIDRSRDQGARRPRPVPVDEAPAPVMIGSPAPRRRVHPGPAVDGVEDPRAGAVRRPPGRHARRHPHRPVRRDSTPGAVRVQIAQPVRARGNVARACRVDEPLGPRVVPAVPLVERRRGGERSAADSPCPRSPPRRSA